MQSLKELLTARTERITAARRILDRADAEKRNLNSEENAEYEKIDAEIEGLCGTIDESQQASRRQERSAAYDRMLSASPIRQTEPTQPHAKPASDPLSFDCGRAGKLSPARHALSARATPEYNAAFLRYISGQGPSGPDGPEQLGLVVGTESKGGATVPLAFYSQLIKFLDDQVFVRRLGTVLPPTTAKTVGLVSYDADYGDADWTAEVPASDIAEDDAATFGTREMAPHLLTKLLKASTKLVRSSTLPIDSFLAQRLAYLFGVTEEKAFLTGTGSSQPLGVFTASANGVTTAQDVTASSATAFTADDLINTLADLKDQYAMRASWIGTREFRKRCRKLKDTTNNYLLNENGAGVTQATLLERPLYCSEYAPDTYTTGLYVAVVGDFSHYWIQDSVGMEIQYLDQLFALRNQVGWMGRKETDGMPVLAEAFRRVKLG